MFSVTRLSQLLLHRLVLNLRVIFMNLGILLNILRL